MNVINQISERQPLSFTVSDYRILDEAGAFEGRPKVELIEGVLLTVSPQRNWHFFVKSELGRRLGNALEVIGLPLRAGVDGTLQLSDDSAPGPDIVIATPGSWDDYLQGPAAQLVIEVADTTLKFDLGTKRSLYARHGVPEYWVVSREAVYRFWAPVDGEYQSNDEHPLGGLLKSATVPGLAVESDGLI